MTFFQLSLANLPSDTWLNIETECESLEDFLDTVEAEGISICTSLRTKPTNDRGVREIYQRDDVGLSIDGIEWIRPATIKFVEGA